MSEKNTKRGMLQVYTGDGKGKTTAALGLALRACGHGLVVRIVQFMKNPKMMDDVYGELKAKDLLPTLEIFSFGLPKWIRPGNIAPEDIEEVKKAFEKADELNRDSRVDMLILDEVFLPIHFGIISVDRLIEFIDSRASDKEIILTGRKAPEKIIEKADLVTEMKEIKHYFSQGISARKGIEY